MPLVALLAFIYWLDKQVQHATANVAINNQRHDPDGIMDNFTATKMNQQGIPSFLLSAQQLRHYPDHNSTELEMPRVTLLNKDLPTVHAQGIHGTISKQGNEVILFKEVEVLREATPRQSAMTLHTEYLRLLPNKDWANTDRAVTMVDENNTVHAIGMEMDNKAGTLKLLSHVRSEYLPNAK
ncbi:MAG: LPS export ABC transporter periplasmic protein LptC [Gallionella sp.]